MEQQEFDRLIAELKAMVADGDVQAMKDLGDALYQGINGSGQNIDAAFPYWKMAADAGNIEMCVKTGVEMCFGNETNRNFEEGFKYLFKGAEAGDVAGIYSTGLAYLNGYGVVKNFQTGVEYIQSAALQNYSWAQLDLAIISANNMKDVGTSIHWLCCAHMNGLQDATVKLNNFIRCSNDPEQTQGFVEREMVSIRANGIDPRYSYAINLDSSPSSTSSSEGCYIATAVYGSYDAPEVMVLRRFRDNVLKKRFWGRIFIKMYYCISPPIAEKLKNANGINQIIKSILNRFVKKWDK